MQCILYYILWLVSSQQGCDNININNGIYAYVRIDFYFFLLDRRHHECCELSPTPDEAVFRSLASVYASNHPDMRHGNNCNETFVGGITNGAFWYELSGKSILLLLCRTSVGRGCILSVAHILVTLKRTN